MGTTFGYQTRLEESERSSCTICKNQLRIGDSKHTFPRLTNTNAIQAKALQLLDIKPAA